MSCTSLHGGGMLPTSRLAAFRAAALRASNSHKQSGVHRRVSAPSNLSTVRLRLTTHGAHLRQLVLASFTLGSLATAPSTATFPSGERVEYDVRFGFIHAGSGALTVVGIDTVR